MLAALEAGEGSQRQVAERFGVGKATLERLVRHARLTGSLEPKSHGGGQVPRITEADRERILEWVRAEPDLTQETARASGRSGGR